MTTDEMVPQDSSTSGTNSATGGATDNPDSGESETSTGGTGAMTWPNGSPCLDDRACASGYCYPFGDVGFCSECVTDADCADVTGFGCTPPDVATDFEGAKCSDGGLGGGCTSSAACGEGLTCEHILKVTDYHDYWSCSACAIDDDCPDSTVCSPVILIEHVNGYLDCVALASVAIGGSCDPFDDGDLVCESGQCAIATIDDLAYIGLCSECDDDADCQEGWECSVAYVATADVEAVPSMCVEAQ